MEEFDIVGIGAGPANLSLVVALLDARDMGEAVPRAVFLEREAQFGWHPGAMLPGSRVQVPFTKDLATQRNPRSRYTFLSYLHEHGRLEDFINLREMFPEREEFAQYMAWIAAEAGGLVRWGREATELFPLVSKAERVERIGVTYGKGDRPHMVSARCLVLGIGSRPSVPVCVADAVGGRIVHTSQLRSRVQSGTWRVSEALEFLVVGAGQSGVEAACFLLSEFAQAKVEICLRRHAPSSIDDNPFVNQWYGSRCVDEFHALDDEARARVTADLSHSNLGVAERGLLDELYRHRYRSLRNGAPRVSFSCGHALSHAATDGEHVTCMVRNLVTDAEIRKQVDGLVLATGYDDAEPALLRPLDPWLVRDSAGACLPRADYRLQTQGPIDAAVFLHGTRADRHGPAERSLSTRAVRAGVLLNSLRNALGEALPLESQYLLT